MQSYLFSPDLSIKISNFSESSRSIHMISIKLSTVILRPKVLMRAQWHKIEWLGSEKDGQNESKNDQKTAIFGPFRFSQKLSLRIEWNFLQSFCIVISDITLLYVTHIRALCVQWHQKRITGIWETAKNSPKMTKKYVICFLHMTKSMCIAVQLRKFFPTIVNFIMSAF